MRFGILFLAVLMVVPCTSFSACASEKLNGKQIQETHSGHSFRFTWRSRTAIARYAKSGGVRVDFADGHTSSGRWHVAGDTLCTSFRDREPIRECVEIFRNGEVFSTPGQGSSRRLK